MYSTSTPRFELLDCWRGAACLMVVVYHSVFYVATPEFLASSPDGVASVCLWLVTKMWAGVPLFFVISGYCIAASVDSHRRRGDGAGGFFLRRFRRIYPPVWAALIITACLVVMLEAVAPGVYSSKPHPLPMPGEPTLWQWLGNVTLTESWRYHAVGGPQQYYGGQLWTLCYEEQFYLVAGLLMLLAPRRFYVGAAVVSLVVVVAGFVSPLPFEMVKGFFFDGRWLHFAAGMAAYFALNRATRLQYAVIVVVLVAACLWQFFPDVQPAMFDSGRLARLVAFSFALLMLFMKRFDDVAKSRWLLPLRASGLMCYSVYLMHWPVVKALSHTMFQQAGVTSVAGTLLLTVPCCLVASLAVGAVFYWLVERHCVSEKRSNQKHLASVAEGVKMTPSNAETTATR